MESQLFEPPRETKTSSKKNLPTFTRPPTVSPSLFFLVGSSGEPNSHHWKFADWIRLNPSLSSRHRTEKSPRTDNKSFIVFQNPIPNNRQSLIRVFLDVLSCLILNRSLYIISFIVNYGWKEIRARWLYCAIIVMPNSARQINIIKTN